MAHFTKYKIRKIESDIRRLNKLSQDSDERMADFAHRTKDMNLIMRRVNSLQNAIQQNKIMF